MSVGLWCVAGFDCCTLTKALTTVNAFRPLHLRRHVGFTCVYIRRQVREREGSWKWQVPILNHGRRAHSQSCVTCFLCRRVRISLAMDAGYRAADACNKADNAGSRGVLKRSEVGRTVCTDVVVHVPHVLF
jgi:hypothetical protein